APTADRRQPAKLVTRHWSEMHDVQIVIPIIKSCGFRGEPRIGLQRTYSIGAVPEFDLWQMQQRRYGGDDRRGVIRSLHEVSVHLVHRRVSAVLRDWLRGVIWKNHAHV